jgi:adenylyl-sulfate kinase
MGNEKGITLWFTGLSGSGKTTIAVALEKYLREKGLRVERLDGDLVREYLTRDLGFSREDRDENIRRVSYVAALLTRNGVITLCSFISPYRQARAEARALIGSFAEVYVNAPLDICEKRDVKGLYQKARVGEIPEFTGVSDPYEPPENPEIELRTDRLTVEECLELVVGYLARNGYLHS